MNIMNIPDYAGPEVILRGKQILKNNRVSHFSNQTNSDHSIVFSAKISDVFNYVDHPKITMDSGSGNIIGYSCDCPGSKQDGSFCQHCAALALLASQPDEGQEPVGPSPVGDETYEWGSKAGQAAT